nr:hypothetical protein [Tanacetum cinerariifolium]
MVKMVMVLAGIMANEVVSGVRMVVMIRGDSGYGGEGDEMMMVVRWASMGGRRWVAGSLAGSGDGAEKVREWRLSTRHIFIENQARIHSTDRKKGCFLRDCKLNKLAQPHCLSSPMPILPLDSRCEAQID